MFSEFRVSGWFKVVGFGVSVQGLGFRVLQFQGLRDFRV